MDDEVRLLFASRLAEAILNCVRKLRNGDKRWRCKWVKGGVECGKLYLSPRGLLHHIASHHFDVDFGCLDGMKSYCAKLSREDPVQDFCCILCRESQVTFPKLTTHYGTEFKRALSKVKFELREANIRAALRLIDWDETIKKAEEKKFGVDDEPE